ncbi:hypothetical protein AURDEDRAFT_175353 [Auricularia subglabra TFB-10046 SS5]|uniref:EthD domain-containing protein n=1 Tax=Auricularia subglabra (strain TFB-10046 / SS5) TaxID=717982 RepID=J0WRZ2_AURST|nr:hypothetical protein AURDEDRAFT_175353 [Auricularia subglabra TFB-10046 SS5]
MPRLVKFSMFIKRKEGINLEEFHKYWSEDHARILLAVPIVKEKIVKYVQYHANTEQMAAMAATGGAVAQWDGIVEFWARSMEDLVAVFTDPVFTSTATPDASKFGDTAASQTFIGYEEVKLDSEA